MKRWFAVYTHPHSEQKALEHLGRQGFETYLPRLLKRRSHARRIDTVAAPLFPRYLFVRLNSAGDRWRSVRSTIGVSHLVCRGDEPVSVPEEVIDEIRAREDRSGMIRLESSLFRSGQQVQIVSGALCDQVGLFDCQTDDERVVILLGLLGREIRVRVPIAVVAAA